MRRRPRVLLFGDIHQPPFVNNLLGPLRAFERAFDLKLVEPRQLEGFVPTGCAAPAPMPLASTVRAVAGFDAEIVICLGGAIFVPDEVKRALSATAVYVGFALSDPLALPSSLAVAPHFDLFYSHDPTSFPAYRKAGIQVRECAPAVDAELFSAVDAAKTWDVFFVGKFTAYRQETVRRLAERFAVRLHGHAGEQRWTPMALPPLATPGALRDAICSARLCLEFALIDDYPPPAGGTWRLTNRPQFAALCGVPSLIEDNPLLSRYFVPGEEIIPFRDSSHLVALTQELLSNPGRCAEMGRRARERVLREHLWDHRVAMVLADVEAAFAARNSMRTI